MNHTFKRSKALIFGAMVLLVVAVVALVLTASLAGRTAGVPAYAGGYPVHISEVMTYNTLAPNEEGVLCDWVELANTSDNDFDLSGYQLSDEAGKGKYTFPAGSVVPAGGYWVVWCDSTAREGDYAQFSLKREGEETVYLMNSNGVVLDSVAIPDAERNDTLIRSSDGTLTHWNKPTPGYPNNETGYANWQTAMAGRSGETLVLSEVMIANTLYASPDGVYCDWVEIHNPTEYAVRLDGYKLSDREGERKYEFPQGESIPAGGYRVVWCSKEYADLGYAPFALAKDGGETLYLVSPGNSEADHLELPQLESNRSLALGGDGSWAVTEQATPGYANTQAGYEEYCLANGAGDIQVVISEVASRNNGILRDGDGDYSDWVELKNMGGAEADLTGWYLSDKEEEPNRWKLPAVVLQPGEELLIFTSGKNRSEGAELHTDFSLSDGEQVLLSTPNGLVYAHAELGILTDGHSLALESSGTMVETAFPTPGYSNDPAGYEAFSQSQPAAGPLAIWEVMTSNATLLEQPNVGCSDWVEIKNISDGPVELSDYTLTDSKKTPNQWALPAGVLLPGESVIYYCAGDESYTTADFVHTNFALSSGGEALYLYKNGVPQDGVYLHSIPSGGSMGRMEGENGFFYLTTPTPGGDNTGGVRMVAQTPTTDTPAGVYEGVNTLTVALSGQGTVHYTTDGSTPTRNSPVYSQPLELNKTTVIRARSFYDGMLDSETLTLSYIINEGHELPVVSLVADPGNLFGGQGIYTSHEMAWMYDWEREATLAFFEEGGSFTIDCGVQIHGQTSRRASEKRSMKVMFRGSYDGDLHYDVFGDGKITEFSSLILRGSLEDTYSSYMRDEFFAEIAMAGTDVIAQNYRYSVLYINGEYWGIYAIREHLSDNYFATHYGVDKDTVDRQNGTYKNQGPWLDLMDYCQYNDMTTTANYEYLKERLDVEEMIEWLILQCYSGNIDVYGNVRFYASPDYNGGRYMYGLVDMDLTMMNHGTYSVGFDGTGQLHGIIPLSVKNNPEFRDRFLTRLGEMLAEDLSRENTNRVLDGLVAQVRSEVPRDTVRWGYNEDIFRYHENNLRTFVEYRVDEMLGDAKGFFGMTDDEVQKYFGAILG